MGLPGLDEGCGAGHQRCSSNRGITKLGCDDGGAYGFIRKRGQQYTGVDPVMAARRGNNKTPEAVVFGT